MTNNGTHYYKCNICHGVSIDSDTHALSGFPLTPASVPHDYYCPGNAFAHHVMRVETYTHTGFEAGAL